MCALKEKMLAPTKRKGAILFNLRLCCDHLRLFRVHVLAAIWLFALMKAHLIGPVSRTHTHTQCCRDYYSSSRR